MRLTAIVLVLSLAGCGTPDATRTERTLPRDAAPRDAWSPSVDGVSGRLRLSFEDLAPGLRFAAHVELASSRSDAVTVLDQPSIVAALYDARGRPVPQGAVSASGPIPFPKWVTLAAKGALVLRVDGQTLGVPTRAHGMVLLGVGSAWDLRPGSYVLEARAVFPRDLPQTAPHMVPPLPPPEGSPPRWGGELALPAIDVVVTPEMVAPAT